MIKQTLKLAAASLAFLVVATGVDLRPASVLQHGIDVSAAQARIGRPATPLSVAGTARRTTRRVIRRTSYYYATLPTGCIYPSAIGAYYQCGSTYYEQVGNQYVIVNVQ